MRDLVHPYLGLGGVPLAEPGTVLKSGRETAEMERIRGEILRLGSAHGPDPDWRTVVECGVIILRDQRKDLQVACYLAWGLFEREGYIGLAVGLTIVKDMAALYWDGLHPPVDRPKARLACLDWLAENLSARIERRMPAAGDGASLERALAVLVDLEEALRQRFGHKAPPFGHVRRQVAEYLGRLPGPKPALAPAVEAGQATSRPSLPPVAQASVPDEPPPPSVVTVIAPPPPTPTESRAKAAPDKALPPTRPRHVAAIRTPVERSRRRARIVAVAAVGLLILGLSGSGLAYWMYEVRQIETVSTLLRSSEEVRRWEGVAALRALPERQRAVVLHDQAGAILEHFLTASERAADRYALLEAEEHLAAARILYPDSVRLAQASDYLGRRMADLGADIRQRLDATRARVESRLAVLLPAAQAADARAGLRLMLRHIEEGDLRNARATLDRLAARVPGSDGEIAGLVPRLTALAFLDLAERNADRQHFTRSLQIIGDGLTFLPDDDMLRLARQRYLTERSEFLLRNTVAAPESLDTLLVREAAEYLRVQAPGRFADLAGRLAEPLAASLEGLESENPERARSLATTAALLFASPAAPAGR